MIQRNRRKKMKMMTTKRKSMGRRNNEVEIVVWKNAGRGCFGAF